MRLLYIHPGPVPPATDPERNQVFYVPAHIGGDILLPTWWRSPEQAERVFGKDWQQLSINGFQYHLYLAGKFSRAPLLQKFVVFLFFLREGWRVYRRKRFDCIMCYNWGLPAVAALLLKWSTGARLIVELANVPQDMYRFISFTNGFGAPADDLPTRFARFFSQVILRLAIRSADRVRLRYPDQLSHYPELQHVPVSVIHPFVPVSRVPTTSTIDNTIVLVGAPWYVKGVDILIRAFRKIEGEFPEFRLQVMGYYADKKILEDLAGDSRQIEFLTARPNPEALKVIAKASIFALASRTDCTPCVIVEAMAAGRPVIASRVGGIPHYVHDGVTGFLFESENVDELAEKLRTLLRSPELRKRMGDRAYEMAHSEWTEAKLGQKYAEMVALTVNGQQASVSEVGTTARQ